MPRGTGTIDNKIIEYLRVSSDLDSFKDKNGKLDYDSFRLALSLQISGVDYSLSEKPLGTEIIIPIDRIKDNDEKKKIYESLAEYYKNINGGRFTEFLSKFYRGEIK